MDVFFFYLFIIDSTDKLVRGDVYRMNQIIRGWTDGLTRVSDMGDRAPLGASGEWIRLLDTSPASVLLGSLIAGSLAELMGMMGDDGRHWVPVRLHDSSIMPPVARHHSIGWLVVRAMEKPTASSIILTAFNYGVFIILADEWRS